MQMNKRLIRYSEHIYRKAECIFRKRRYNERMDSVGNVELFGTTTRTSTLLVIQMLGETHGAEIARILGRSPSRIKDSVDSLERAGIIISNEVGKTRRVRLNPRFAASEELRALLAKLGMMDLELQKQLATIRRRPRRAGKAI